MGGAKGEAAGVGRAGLGKAADVGPRAGVWNAMLREGGWRRLEREAALAPLNNNNGHGRGTTCNY